MSSLFHPFQIWSLHLFPVMSTHPVKDQHKEGGIQSTKRCRECPFLPLLCLFLYDLVSSFSHLHLLQLLETSGEVLGSWDSMDIGRTSKCCSDRMILIVNKARSEDCRKRVGWFHVVYDLWVWGFSLICFLIQYKMLIMTSKTLITLNQDTSGAILSHRNYLSWLFNSGR